MRISTPLRWPSGWPRTPAHERDHTRYRVGIRQATSELRSSLVALGAKGKSVLLTTDASNDEPFAVDDPGVAVYWSTESRVERVMACDRWGTVRENVRAIGLAVDGLLAIDRAGATQILDRAYSAFGALSGAVEPRERPWWEVFGVSSAERRIALLNVRYRELARKAHPDMGGSVTAMATLNRAREEMLRDCAGS